MNILRFNEAKKDEICQYNDEISCNDYSGCDRCGWCPATAAKRHEETLQKYGVNNETAQASNVAQRKANK